MVAYYKGFLQSPWLLSTLSKTCFTVVVKFTINASASEVDNLTRKLRRNRSFTSLGDNGGPSKAFTPADASKVNRRATSPALLRALRNVLLCLMIAVFFFGPPPSSRSRDEPGLPLLRPAVRYCLLPTGKIKLTGVGYIRRSLLVFT